MLFYWAMFVAPAIASLSPVRFDQRPRLLLILAAVVLLVVVVGWRDHVGADWEGYTYLFQFNQTSLSDIFQRKEAGFGLLNWICGQLHLGQVGVDVVCATIFAGGFFAFFRRHESFFLALTLATPTLVIGVAMSAERQSAAIGFMMFALNAFQDRRAVRYLAFIFLGALFHQTVVVFAAYVFFIRGNLGVRTMVLGITFFVLSGLFALKDLEFYSNTYVLQDQGGAAGAFPRIILTLAAAIIYFVLRKRWADAYGPSPLYALMALTAVILAPSVFYVQIAADRLLQYLLPFQISVFARVPFLIRGRTRPILTVLVIATYALSLAVWLNFSWIAQLGWLPYHTTLFKPPGGS
jgi:hypothetical protein